MVYTALGKGDFNSVHQALVSDPRQPVRCDRLLSKLRGARFDGAPLTANLAARYSHGFVCSPQSGAVNWCSDRLLYLAAAGEGKSELAVKAPSQKGNAQVNPPIA
ncbi:hypothetical protein O5541_27350 [Escherichia coli]|nr:hypothetical protein [Escherichia coli]